jgi:hypothetical protein|nr:hypothetical protein [uncultured Undibacterium sp.]
MNTKLFTTLKISGDSAYAILMQQRNSYHQSGDYPFLIGEADNVERFQKCKQAVGSNMPTTRMKCTNV